MEYASQAHCLYCTLPIRQNCPPSTSRSNIGSNLQLGLSTNLRQQRRVEARVRRKTAVIDAEMFDESLIEMRPWTDRIPTFFEVLNTSDWPDKIRDWLMFWGMFQNWQWANEQVIYNEGNLSPVAFEQMRWLQLPFYLSHYGSHQDLETVIDKVVAEIPRFISEGQPVPDFIRGKMPWHTGIHETTIGVDTQGRQYLERGEIKGVNPLFQAPREDRPSQFEFPEASRARPWDDWDEWDYRVFMEKKRRHRQEQAKWAKKQAEVGKKKYLVVSPLTDYRFAEEVPFYPVEHREHTHEEFMKVVTGDGKYVDPRLVPIGIRNPDVWADAFNDGAHWVPDVIDYCRSIGRLAESEEELLGVDNSEPSATLDEEFSELGEGPLAEVESDAQLDDFDEVADEGLEPDEGLT